MVINPKATYKLKLNERLAYVSSEESGEDDGKPVKFRPPLYWIKGSLSVNWTSYITAPYLPNPNRCIHAQSDGALSTRALPSKVPVLVSKQPR